LNLEHFIAKRLITTKDHKSSISTPIIKIAITAIALGIIMMIVSVATGIGLQQKYARKYQLSTVISLFLILMVTNPMSVLNLFRYIKNFILNSKTYKELVIFKQ